MGLNIIMVPIYRGFASLHPCLLSHAPNGAWRAGGSEESDGMDENFGSFGKSRNAFGTAHRPGGRLLLCDVAALRLPFGLPFGREHFVVLEHFVVGKDGKKGKSFQFSAISCQLSVIS